MNPTVALLSRSMQQQLSPLYGPGEAKAMVQLIFHALKGWNLTGLVIHADNEVSDYLLDKCTEILRRLKTHEPIQYILGEAYFYGMNLRVNRATLIPRPETEELVDIIVRENNDTKDLRILDVGTGSGAIAIALSRNLPFSSVTAIDISADALDVARQNAADTHAHISFLEADIFSYRPMPASFDIIVSNPPYIDESEKAQMDPNVLEYEPHSALFVPDSDPLRFYRRIAQMARGALTPGGRLYFEINPRHARELTEYLESLNFDNIQLINDINNKIRFISAIC